MTTVFYLWLLLWTTLLVGVKGAFTTLTQNSGTITLSITDPSINAQWIINPSNPAATAIQFVIQSMSITQASIIIFDTIETSTDVLIWNCNNCGSVPPPSFYSETGIVSIHASGIFGTAFTPSQFTLQYICLPTIVTPSLSHINIFLGIGYAKIRPQLFNGVLPANSVQIWNISEPSRTNITFSFAKFAFGTTCSAHLKIYDNVYGIGNQGLLFKGCVSDDVPLKWLYSTTGQALVILVATAQSDPAADFTLTYYADEELWQCGSFVTPDIMNDRSMIISDGSQSTNLMRRGQQCEWLIRPYQNNTVTLLMQWVSLKGGGTVKIYDNDQATGYILWNGQGPSFVTPPPITSTGNSLYVVYTTSSGISTNYFGFKGEFFTNFANSVGMGSLKSVMTMSAVHDLTLPGNNINYLANYTYTWYLRPSNILGVLSLVISEMNLPKASGDKLVLYDGEDITSPILATFTGDYAPFQWFKTSSSVATMQFTSDSRPAHVGHFKLSYWADGSNYHCGFTTNPLVVTASSMTLTDGSMSTEALYPNQDCEWNVSPRSAQGVYLFFTMFNMLGGSLSVYTGSVASGQLYVTISDSSTIPAPIYIPSDTVGLVYSTGAAVAGYGFSLSYFGLSQEYVGPGDGVIRLYCASMISLKMSETALLGSSSNFSNNITWQLNPLLSSGRIYFFFTALLLTPLDSYLEIFDGPSLDSPLLGKFTSANFASLKSSWLQTSSNNAMMRYIYTGQHNTSVPTPSALFDLSFFSDGSNTHCGFAVNPAHLTADSMVFTDGSSSTQSLQANQYCEWIIAPLNAETLQGQDVTSTVVLEFLSNDLRGAMIEVFDGLDSSANLTWRCRDCQYVPRPIISTTGTLFIRYASYDNSMGSGFQATYWTLHQNITSWQHPNIDTEGHALVMPAGMEMISSLDNTTTVWVVGINALEPSTLKYSPRHVVTREEDIFSDVSDGRSAQSIFKSLHDTASTCGAVSSRNPSVMTDNLVYLHAMQYTNNYLKTSESSKVIANVTGSSNLFLTDGSDVPFAPAQVCKYLLDSGSTTSIAITINEFFSSGFDGHLRIYTGITGTDYLAFDSYDSNHMMTSQDILSATDVLLKAPCGKATIFLELNTSHATEVNYGLNLEYMMSITDHGDDCLAYIQSLQPIVIKVNPWIPYYYGAGAFFFLVFFSLFAYCYRKKLYSYCAAMDFKQSKSYQVITPVHPKYTPKFDEFRNKFLSVGLCCVCRDPKIKVFKLACAHSMCLDDIKGYLESCLGDISMFPVKCPMHYEGCTGQIDAQVAKRVVTKIMYERFLEFSDRAVYGEGMRCIYCNNFVNYPVEGHAAMVECPYCIQKFCMRCKKPWHYGAKCPLDNVDDSLDTWKKDSGAQKCPACHKLIEKDGDGCNHMVHKVTDGIPCVRDRTDFCYLCGEEVTQDYPHEEVQNKGVNHFPDGVFQKCRVMAAKEREAERDRLKKLRRMRARAAAAGARGKPGSVVPSSAGDEWDDESDGLGGAAGGGGGGGGAVLNQHPTDRFDNEWDNAMATASTTSTSVIAPNSAHPTPTSPANNNINFSNHIQPNQQSPAQGHQRVGNQSVASSPPPSGPRNVQAAASGRTPPPAASPSPARPQARATIASPLPRSSRPPQHNNRHT